VIKQSTPPGALDQVTTNAAAWNEAILASDGHLLQSWRWGSLKSQFGWETERLAASSEGGLALAQVLFRRKAGVSIGYIPRGPALPSNDPGALTVLWPQIEQAARERRALTVIIESDEAIPASVARELRLDRGPTSVQPTRSVKIDLSDDETLLKQMHQKTRYNVRLAQRRGVEARIAEYSESSLRSFYELLQDTSVRNDFAIHTLEYYRRFLQLFERDAVLIFANIDNRPVAGIVAAAFGNEAIYMYGASSTKDRAHGAGFLIQFEAMRWARERGCLRYDLWGIPPIDPQSTKVHDGDRIAGTTGSDWRGLYEFKTRFGGSIVSYPEPLERRYHPILIGLARRFYGGYGGE
jgi:peptidoglycan pentaglycine glycine transferase (the first glycine)